MKRYTYLYLPYLLIITLFLSASKVAAQMPGSIPGILSASGTGAATYTIPIECPKGVGLEPSIALVYNSQSGKGIAGQGWNLSGLSSISRTNKTSYFDGKDKIISWDIADALTLNGQRLIQDFRRGDSIQYRLENDPGTLVVGYGVTSSAKEPAYLKAYTKDGKTLTYGNPSAPNSYIHYYENAQTASRPVIACWNLVETVDANGNYMQFEYSIASGGYRGNVLSAITYGRNKNNGNTGSLLKIAFSYEKRPDEQLSYLAGKESLQQLRLTKIQTYVGSVARRAYTLTYQTGTHISLLASVDLINSGVKMFNTLNFSYGNASPSPTDTDISFIQKDERGNEKTKLGLIAVDLDGDGVCELGDVYSTIIRDTVGYQVIPTSVAIFDIHHRNNNFITQNRFRAGYSNVFGSSDPRNLFGDFNGNGAADVVNIYNYDNLKFVITDCNDINSDPLFEKKVRLAESSPFTVIGACGGYPLSTLIAIYKEPASVSGGYRYDYDIIAGGINGTELKPSLHMPQNKSIVVPRKIEKVSLEKIGIAANRDDLWLILDDGSTRIIVNDQNNMNAFFMNGQIIDPGIKVGEDAPCRFGDMNGDGLADIVFRKPDKTWWVAYNKGNYTFKQQQLNVALPGVTDTEDYYPLYWVDKEGDDIFLLDINRDGLMDIVAADGILIHDYYQIEWQVLRDVFNFSKTHWTVWLNNGNGFTKYLEEISFEKPIYSCLGDFKGNGSINWVRSKGEVNRKVVMTDFGFDPNLNVLNKVWTLPESAVEISYESQPNTSIGIDTSTPYNYFQLGHIPFKTSMLRVFSESNDGLNHLSYKYDTPLINWKHGGFSGFRNTEIKNEKTNITELNKNDFIQVEGNFNQLVPTSKITYAGTDPSDKIRTETNEYSIRTFAPKRYSLRLTKNIRQAHLPGEATITTVNETFDDWNNILAGYTESYGQKERHEYTYGKFGSWCNNRVTKDVLTTTSLSDRTSIVRTSLFAYDGKGNLTESKKDNGNVNMVTTRYKNYNVYGNPLQVEELANSEYRYTNYTYTPSGRFIASETNPLGETISYIWNEGKGLMTQSTDRTGTTQYNYHVSYEYLTKVTYPTGLMETHSFGRSTDTPGASYTQQTRDDLPGRIIKTYFDKYGREYARERYSPTGTKLYSITEYYPNGQLYRVLKGNMHRTLDVSYTYDKYGRVASIRTMQDSTTMTYGSSNSSLATNFIEERTASGHITRKNWNTYGQLVTVTTDGKAVNFTYSAGNRLKKSQPDGGIAIQMEYDLQGNRTKLIDPDAGTITSNYNGRGQLQWEQQRTFTNQVVTNYYNYTPSGLLQLKTVQNSATGATESTKYEYDSKNRLIKNYMVGGNHTCNYEYDNFDRTTKVTELIKGKTFVTERQYDISGRITKQIFPTGYFITNSYSFGYLKKVTDDASRVVWELTEIDDGGKVKKEKKNGVTTSFTYDSFTQQISSIQATGIVDMNYTYYVPYTAKGGNLKMYRDGISNQQETYTYDNMDRLVNWKTPTDYYPNYKAEYISSGNRITFKYDWLDYGNIYGYKSSTSNQIDYIDYTGAPRPGGGFTHSAVQEINYTDFNKVKLITMDDQTCTIEYGVGQQRVYMKLNRGRYYSERYYAGDYEEDYDTETGVRSKIHYLYGDNGLAGMYIIKGTTGTLYSTYTDRQGSLVALANGSTLAQPYAYDPWGKRRNPANWLEKDTRSTYGFNALLSYRGYCMHEHLDSYGLINMNARMYEPLTGTFISPDPQLQAPESWLNYNRYAYCLNNPLKYTDPNGEFALLAGIGGFVTSYLSHGISTGNWGWDAVIAGGFGFVSSSVGYAGMKDTGMSQLQYVGLNALNTAIGFMMPSINIISTEDFNMSINPFSMLLISSMDEINGFSYGFGVSMTAKMGDWNIHRGMNWNLSGNDFGYVGTTYFDGRLGASWHTTHYAETLHGVDNGQRTATVALRYKDFTIAHENDVKGIGGDGGDRFRSAALEVGYKNYIVGVNVYTNDPKKNGVNDKKEYKDGQQWSSPLYIGKRSGHGITKIGYEHPIIGEKFQNNFHRLMGYPTLPISHVKKTPYVWSGRYNGYTMY